MISYNINETQNVVWCGGGVGVKADYLKNTKCDESSSGKVKQIVLEKVSAAFIPS